MDDFALDSTDPLVRQVHEQGFATFGALCEHVRALAYRRTQGSDVLDVLVEGCGTCSSKHRLLATVAQACGHPEVQLTIGIYEMSESNTPGVGAALLAASLTSLPEAHCYLTVEGHRLDFTGLTEGSSSPYDHLLAEHLVSPDELPTRKLALHRQVLHEWAIARALSPEVVWEAREAAIVALATRSP
jgi:hypothetical protein